MRSFITNNTAVLDDIKKYHADEADRFRGALREIKDNFQTQPSPKEEIRYE